MTINSTRKDMFQKPGPATPDRQAAWEQMREKKEFSIDAIAISASVPNHRVRKYIKLLMVADYVEHRRHNCYWLLRDTGEKAPEITPSKEFLYDHNKDRFIPVFPKVEPFPGKPHASESAEGRMWLGLRILKTSTASELASVSELPYRKVTGWLRCLKRFDYVREVGESGGEACYRLVRITGTKAPAFNMEKGMLFDHNTHRIITLQGE